MAVTSASFGDVAALICLFVVGVAALICLFADGVVGASNCMMKRKVCENQKCARIKSACELSNKQKKLVTKASSLVTKFVFDKLTNFLSRSNKEMVSEHREGHRCHQNCHQFEFYCSPRGCFLKTY